ncbi:MAG TPA: creatininase family protein [Halococcus sp.]|nr:creatininase family protein [Halococcus sp.]
MHLAEATWTDADSIETDLALVPVGSTEQHGPHAPLGTDTLTARTIATAGADAYEEATDHEVVVAPAIPVAVAEEHRQFSGTLWISPDTFRSYVREIVSSLASHGWTKTVLVNGHGGNVGALREVAAAITRHDDAYAVPFTWFEATASMGEMGHGGPLETTLLRAIEPDLVREERIEEARAGASERWGEWVSKTNIAFDSVEFTDNGVVGDPSEGDAERGEELLERATTALVALLEAIEKRA